MTKRTLFFLILLYGGVAQAQTHLYDSYQHAGEFGLGIGAGHYFGDLNTRAAVNRPKFSGEIFYVKQFNNYVGLRVNGAYAFLGYSDTYSNNPTQQRRNLSFNSNVWEMSVSGYFNFFRFIPGVDGYRFSPYMSLGVGFFSYDPYAYLYGQKYFLRPLHTEGQGLGAYPDRKEYSTMAVCIPFTVGVKYSLSEKVNLFGEVGYRFTNTDYLDDVSTTYAGAEYFPTDANGQPTPAYLLQDRSYETGSTNIGIKGRQRGNSTQKDTYVLAHVGLSFNLTSYKCPTARVNQVK